MANQISNTNFTPGQIKTIDPNEIDSTLLVDNGDDQKRLRALITRRHPEYDETKVHWEFLEDTYEGGRDWFSDGNIFRYMKEGTVEFSDRLKRAYRFNHTREVVDLLNKYLFKQNIVRNMDDAPDSLKDFWNKSTRNGLGIKDFSRQVSKKASIYGRVGIVVDNMAGDDDLSKAEAKLRGSKVYAYIVSPEQLLDYSWDEQGDLDWILIEECHRDDEDPFTSSGKEHNRFRLWTKNDWKLFEEQQVGRKKIVVQIDGAIHGLGEVPVILSDNIITDELYCAPALIDDIAYLDRAVANYLSNLDAIIQDQTFSQLAMPAQNILPGEDAYTKLTELGTKRVFLYDAEGHGQPFFLSPDPKQAQMILAAINKIINEIYHTVGLAGERTKQDNALGIDNSSGVAKAYDFERVNALLAAKADSLEVFENKLAHLVTLWTGEEDQVVKDLVSYPDNFDTRGLYDEFDLAARLMLIEAPDVVRQEQMGTLLDKLFPQIGQDRRDKMDAGIKDWPPVLILDPTSGQQSLTKTSDKATAKTVLSNN